MLLMAELHVFLTLFYLWFMPLSQTDFDILQQNAAWQNCLSFQPLHDEILYDNYLLESHSQFVQDELKTD